MPKAIKTKHLLELLSLAKTSISKEKQQEINYVILCISGGHIHTSKKKPYWSDVDQEWIWGSAQEYYQAGADSHPIDDEYLNILDLILPALKKKNNGEILFKIVRN